MQIGFKGITAYIGGSLKARNREREKDFNALTENDLGPVQRWDFFSDNNCSFLVYGDNLKKAPKYRPESVEFPQYVHDNITQIKRV